MYLKVWESECGGETGAHRLCLLCFTGVQLSLALITQAKVSIGVPARAVAFSPNGAHLAVGTNTGEIKVGLLSSPTRDEWEPIIAVLSSNAGVLYSMQHIHTI